MIKAEVPQDVTEYKEQFFLGMTGRQIICIVLILVLGIGTFVIGSKFFTTDILMYLIVIEVAPLAAVGFLKYNGMGFEKIAVKVGEFYFGSQRRKMKYLPEETEIHDKVREIILAAEEKERKTEIKEQKHKCKQNAKAEKKNAKAKKKNGSEKKCRKQKSPQTK